MQEALRDIAAAECRGDVGSVEWTIVQLAAPSELKD